VTNLENGRSIVVRVNDRGPYARSRVIDLSIGTAKALDFYSRGLARVRVEYVGRAPVEGSDDEMLMATLREGSPAPAPSKVMIAAAKPFIPKPGDGKDSQFTLSSASSSPAKPAVANEASVTDRPKSKPAARPTYASAAETRTESPPSSAVPAIGFAPSRNEGNALGLMSGRGLY
jgi:rare lipoprotein A